MSAEINKNELIKVGQELGIKIILMNKAEAKSLIQKTLEKYKPFKTSEHLQLDDNAISFPADGNEYKYFEYLKPEPVYVFFEQYDYVGKHTVVIIHDVNQAGKLFFESFGMEYFLTNKDMDYLIAVNWYAIHVAGTAIQLLEHFKE